MPAMLFERIGCVGIRIPERAGGGTYNPPVGRLRVAMTVEQCWHRVPGGTGIAALGMARALTRRGELELTGVAALHRGAPPDPWRPPLPVRHLPLPRHALYPAWHRLRRPGVGPADVVHATSLAVPPRSAPLLVTIHDLAWRHEPAHFTARGVRFFERGLGLALAEADLVLCSSSATLQDCTGAGFEPGRLRLVPLGVDAPAVSDGDVEQVRRRYGLGPDYVLWTGTIEPRKNLRGLLAALDFVGGRVELALAGPRGWNEDIGALVEASRHSIKTLGFVPSDDLAALYAGARVFCFPSLLEGFGFPVLEAMAQATPVVTSRATSTEEIAGEAALLVDPRDPASIGAGLERLLRDDELARRLGEKGRVRASSYTWERCAGLVAEAYAEAAA